VKIIWDEPKREANLVKHGLDFADLTEIFFANALILPARKNRYRGIGVNDQGVICVVFATYGVEGISVVSMRAARKDEREAYRESL
jgi:uncharacterized DUF497 family protein